MTQLKALKYVMSLLFAPTKCYHSHTEKYFEITPTPNKFKCEKFCSACLGHMSMFTKGVDRDGVISVLTQKVGTSKNDFLAKSLTSLLTTNRGQLFAEGDVPPKSKAAVQVHTLAIQLYASGIIGLAAIDSAPVGNDNFRFEHLKVTLPSAQKKKGTRSLYSTCILSKRILAGN